MLGIAHKFAALSYAMDEKRRSKTGASGACLLGMMNRTTHIIKSIFYLASLLVSGLSFSVSAGAANRDVCPTCTYISIDQAVEAAQSGDTIRVVGGTYSSGISMSNSTKSLRFEGGYSGNFSERDWNAYPSVIPAASLNYYYSGDVVIDGFTIAGSSGQGVFAWSFNSTLTLQNSRVHSHAEAGINLLGIKAATIVGNLVWNNGGYANIDIADASHTSLVITDNTVFDGPECTSCSGIYATNIKSADVIARNTVYGNYMGLNIRTASATEAPSIERNTVYGNQSYGIYFIGGSPTVRHNIIYNNGGHGFLWILPRAGSFLNNVFANNAQSGLFASGNSADTPVIKNNIFYRNQHGLYIAGTMSGWGGTNLRPVTENNAFFENSMGELVHSSEYPWSFESETPGAYGEINAPTWSNFNIVQNPGLVDPDNGDFSLRAESFLIDEGSAQDAYDLEPAPNGGRVNIGPDGNSSNAATSPDAPNLSNLSARENGEDIILSFDTSTTTSAYWLKLEYSTGSAFNEIAASSLEGDSIIRGYKNRVESGSEVEVTWKRAHHVIPAGTSTIALRVTLSHGNQSAVSIINTPVSCSLWAQPALLRFDSNAGSSSMPVSTNCIWSTETDVDWLAVDQSDGRGNTSIGYTLLANTEQQERVGHIYIGGLSFEIVQESAPCADCVIITEPTPLPTATATPSPSPTIPPTAPPERTETPTPVVTTKPTEPPAAQPTEVPTIEPTVTPNPGNTPSEGGAELYQISILSSRGGSIRVRSQSTESCGTGCYLISSTDSRIILVADSNSGYRFRSWKSRRLSLPSACRNRASCRLPVRSLKKDPLVGAEFVKIPRRTSRANKKTSR